MSDGLLGRKKEVKISSVINNEKFLIFTLILVVNRKTEWCVRFVYTEFYIEIYAFIGIS